MKRPDNIKTNVSSKNEKYNDDSENSSWIASTIRFIRRSKLEPLIFLHTSSTTFMAIALNQMLQDKICLQTYGQSRNYCRHLSKADTSNIKDNILSSLSTWLSYKEYIVLIPGILAVMFIGSWCDAFPNGKRYCLLATILTQTMELLLFFFNAVFINWPLYWIIVSFLPPAFLGSGFGYETALISFAPVLYRDDERNMRFILMPVVASVAGVVSQYLAGMTIGLTPMFSSLQLQNYAGNFAVSILLESVAFCWAYFVITNHPRKEEGTITRKEEETVTMKEIGTVAMLQLSTDTTIIDSSVQNLVVPPSQESHLEKLKELLSWKHISSLWRTCLKKRPDNMRLTIWLLMLAVNLTFLPSYGRATVSYPLVQKLFKWDAVQISKVQTITGIIQILGMMLFIPVVFKVLRLRDLQTSILGCGISMIGDLLLGFVVNPYVYYTNSFLVSFSQAIPSGMQTYLSAVLPKNEVSQIFGIAIMTQGVCRCFATVLFAYLFKSTIENNPTFVYHFMAILTFICLVIIGYVELKRRRVPSNVLEKSRA